MSKRDYYEVLGIQKHADDKEIKNTYRKLARKYHPDVNPGDTSAEVKFKEIQEAYEILSNKSKRDIYDRFGHAGVDETYSTGQEGGFGDFGGGMDDIFDMFFGGGGQSRRRSAGVERGADIRYDMEITLEQSASGLEKEISLNRKERCDECGGSGAEPGTEPQTCPNCGGAGSVQRTQNTVFGRMATVQTCERCNGEGKVVYSPCKTCNGSGTVRRNREMNIKIPQGIETGSRLRVPGGGESGPRGGPSGDLYVFITVKPHKLFKREGANIYSQIPISFIKATLGGKVDVPTLEEDVTLNIPSGTQSETSFRLKDKGMPYINGRGKGDHHVKVKIVTPTNLTQKQTALLQKLADELGEDVSEEQKGLFHKFKDVINRKAQGE